MLTAIWFFNKEIIRAQVFGVMEYWIFKYISNYLDFVNFFDERFYIFKKSHVAFQTSFFKQTYSNVNY